MSVDISSTSQAVAFLDLTIDEVICRECLDDLPVDHPAMQPLTQNDVNEYGDRCIKCKIDLASAY